MDKEILKLLPNARGLIDGRAEQMYYLAFSKVYDYFEQKLSQQQKEFESKLKVQSDTISRQGNLVNGFGTQLIGITNQTNPLATLGQGSVTNFTVTDATIFDVTTPTTTPNLALKTQAKNKFLVGPTTGANAVPTFRLIVAADLSGLSLDTNILEWLAQ